MKKKCLAIGAIVVAILSFTIISFAYFTTRVSTSAETTTSILDVTLENLNNQNNIVGKEVLSPGGKRAVTYKVTNVGNIKADLKEVIVLSVTDKNNSPIIFTGSSAKQSEFDLYRASDVELVEGKGYVPKAGATPLTDKAINKNTITYTLPTYSLNAGDSITTDYVLLFKSGVSKDFANACVSLDVSLLAKQNINTNNYDWTEIESKKIL